MSIATTTAAQPNQPAPKTPFELLRQATAVVQLMWNGQAGDLRAEEIDPRAMFTAAILLERRKSENGDELGVPIQQVRNMLSQVIDHTEADRLLKLAALARLLWMRWEYTTNPDTSDVQEGHKLVEAICHIVLGLQRTVGENRYLRAIDDK